METTSGEKIGIVEPTSVETQNFEKFELLKESLHGSKELHENTCGNPHSYLKENLMCKVSMRII